MPKLKIKKNDKVIVIAGKDKGRRGVVIKTFPSSAKVLVSGINVAKKHVKPSVAHGSGGVINKEMPIHISNLMCEDPKLGLPVRIGYKKLDDGNKVRYSKKSGELIM